MGGTMSAIMAMSGESPSASMAIMPTSSGLMNGTGVAAHFGLAVALLVLLLRRLR